MLSISVYITKYMGGLKMIPVMVLRNKYNQERYLAACADVGDWEDENLDV